MIDATNGLQGKYLNFNRERDEAVVLPSRQLLASVGRRVSVTVLCADPVIAAGLATVLGSNGGFQMVPMREGSSATYRGPPADVILADYETTMQLAKAAPEWLDRLLVFSNCDSEARICLALESGARGYLLHGASVVELIDAIGSVRDGGVALSPAVAARIASRVRGQILTPRENAVLGQLMNGLSNKVIANTLHLSVGTVKTHVKRILAKLEAGSRTAAVITAQRRGLLT